MQAWKIIYKDLSLLLKDRIALLLLLGMPLSLTAIIGFSTNQLMFTLYRGEIVLLVLDQDGGETAQQFVQSLTENERFQLQRVDSRKVAESLIRNHDRTAGLVIGPRFGELIDSLEPNDFLNLPKENSHGGWATSISRSLRASGSSTWGRSSSPSSCFGRSWKLPTKGCWSVLL